MPQEPRELTPIQKFWDGRDGVKDFGPRVVHVSSEERIEAEVALTPAPKDEFAAAFADSSDSLLPVLQPESETPVQHELSPTEKLEAAVKESGKDNDENEDEPTTAPPMTPSPAPSSPSSSTETSPGKSTPPVVAKPPTGG